MGIFLGFLYCSIDLYFCFCASTILSWWLWLCSIIQSQEGWFLQLHSPFSRLLWLFRVFVFECCGYVSSRVLFSGLIFRSLIPFEFILVYGVRKCSNFIFFTCSCPVFPAPFIEEAVSTPLYIASFVKNKVPIGAWVYFWAFYLVPVVYISVFVPVPYCFDDYSFVV